MVILCVMYVVKKNNISKGDFMSEELRERAIEQIEERMLELQNIANNLVSENEQLKGNLKEYTRQVAIDAIKRRIEENETIIIDAKKDIDALVEVIDTLRN